MVGFYLRGLEFLPSLSLQSGFGLKLKVASSKIGLKFSFYFSLNSCYSCWKLYWQAYTYNLWYFLSRCFAELETFVNKSFCSWLKGPFLQGKGGVWNAEASREPRIPFILATVDQVIDHKLFTTMTFVAITEEVFMDRH